MLKENPLDCGGIRVVLWSLFAFHIVSGLFCAMALCSLEKRFCSSYLIVALGIFDVIILIWAQVTYFRSQSHDC